MATITYSPLATITVSSTTNEVVFDNIPAQDVNGNDLHHLAIQFSAIVDTNGTRVVLDFNNDNAAVYNYTQWDTRANSTTANSNYSTAEIGKANANKYVGGDVEIFGSHLTENPSWLSMVYSNEMANATEMVTSGSFRRQTGITRVDVRAAVGSFSSGTFSLFGVV